MNNFEYTIKHFSTYRIVLKDKFVFSQLHLLKIAKDALQTSLILYGLMHLNSVVYD